MMANDKSAVSKLKTFADGDFQIYLDTTRAESVERPARTVNREDNDDRKLSSFYKLYKVLSIAISVIIVVALVLTAVQMPEFASETNPTNNEVVARYVGCAEEETGAENAIAGMILNYRGFDTFGESNVLFLAVCCVMLLVMKTSEGESIPAVKTKQSHDPILACVCKILVPCVLVFGVCVLCNGHTSPGGGFSGGSTLGAALILMAVAFGQEFVHRFFTARVFNIVRITGLMIYAVMFGVYIFQGANGVQSDLARYIVLVIDIAVGLVVMSTMYGFYSFYTRGEL